VINGLAQMYRDDLTNEFMTNLSSASESLKRRISFLALGVSLLLVWAASLHAAEDRRAKVLNDRTEVQADGTWIYNDLAQGFAEAAKTRKPMLVIFRCVP
jgi:serine protease Do